mmetsp:Transcript_11806/g.36504  ORF Transcript_11806/g.36504 Transcript_11806/m.36504 type:complete len:230 (+) Transcript_11806:132-821(+)
MLEAICHTCRMLSSATLAQTNSSSGFQAKSLTLLVWPPWMKSSSGGPSLASSGSCSSPMWLRSHTIMRLSAPHDARMVSLVGDQPIWNTSSVWLVKVCSRLLRLRVSCSATVRSADAVATTCSLNGLNASALTSASCACTCAVGPAPPPCRASHNISIWSSPTEPKMSGWRRCQATSSTTFWWPLKMALASSEPFADLAVMPDTSQRQICASSEPESRCPSRCADQLRP